MIACLQNEVLRRATVDFGVIISQLIQQLITYEFELSMRRLSTAKYAILEVEFQKHDANSYQMSSVRA